MRDTAEPAAHTPTMRLELASGGNTGKEFLRDQFGNLLGELYATTSHDEKQIIVRAVNSHAALVEAVEMLLDETNAGTWDCLPVHKARAALALAKP